MAGESQITYERQDDEMIAIIDYDAGNIKSVEKAMQLLGQEVTITRDRETIMNADKVILPGVGAFGDAMGKLRQYGLDEVIRDVTAKGTPFLGICLGLQLLFERSDETPGVEGLGILKGEILRIPDQGKNDCDCRHLASRRKANCCGTFSGGYSERGTIHPGAGTGRSSAAQRS